MPVFIQSKAANDIIPPSSSSTSSTSGEALGGAGAGEGAGVNGVSGGVSGSILTFFEDRMQSHTYIPSKSSNGNNQSTTTTSDVLGGLVRENTGSRRNDA